MGLRAIVYNLIKDSLNTITVAAGFSVDIKSVQDLVVPEDALHLTQYPCAMIEWAGDALQQRGDQYNLSTITFIVRLAVRNTTQLALMEFIDDAEQVITLAQSAVPATGEGAIHQILVESVEREPPLGNKDQIQIAQLVVRAEVGYDFSRVGFIT